MADPYRSVRKGNDARRSYGDHVGTRKRRVSLQTERSRSEAYGGIVISTSNKENRNITETARLNAGQFEAVHIFEGPALVLAGPGSGKTKVITERVRFLTEEKKVDPESILVLTFSKAAATEMQSRYLKLMHKRSTSVTFGTFHSCFWSVLKNDPSFKILKAAERREQMDALKTGMLRKFGKNVFSEDLLNLVLDDIGNVKNGKHPRLSETGELYEAYDQELSERGYLDFDDMLLMFLKQILNDPKLLTSLRKKYRYFLVDEFQDINRVQYEAVKMLAAPKYNLFCVGDDDQSIYGFRGSDPSFMKRLPAELPGTKVLELKTNYRSTEKIVSVTKKLIRKNIYRYQKHPEAVKKGGPDPVIAKFISPKEEAAYISRKVSELREDETAGVLCRTNRAVGDIMDQIPEDVRKRISFHTFHTAKGLEFDCVFVAACNDEVTPGNRVSGPMEMEEERRTFYVAATRAKTYLYFLYTELYKDKQSKPSRFLEELINR